MAFEQHRTTDLASLMGSWPFSPHPEGSSSTPQLFSGTVKAGAYILGSKREPAAGFVFAAGRTINFNVDGSTFQATVPAGTHDLDAVRGYINAASQAAITADIAFRSGDFLLLSSPTTGDGSYIRIWSVAGAEDVFDLLGLFSETESYAGELAEPKHLDPTRQVSLPGQASMLWGEQFDANSFNRMAMGLALNAEKANSLLDRKRTAVRREAEIVYNGSDLYIQIPDTVYTGPASPKMEDLAAILNDSHNEILVEKSTTIDSDLNVDVATDADTGEFIISNAGALNFQPLSSSEEVGEFYVKIFGGGMPAELDGVALKILRVISTSSAVLQNIDPDTGLRVTGSATGAQSSKIQIETEKVKVEGLYKESGLTTDVNQYQESAYSGAVDRIEKSNRIYCSAGTFGSVVAGDLVVWTGSLITDPWTNNGTYRVLRKIDDKTLDLVAEDYTPVILNALEASPTGSIDVKTDGEFWDQPYIKFFDNAVKPPAGTIRVIYLGMSTVRDAMTADPAAMAGSVRYAQEAEFQIQKALMGVVGPSVDTFDDVLSWLYNDRRRNLDGIFNRLDHEHHTDDTSGPAGAGGPGRHSNIRPDTIDMFPEVNGTTVTIRSKTAEAAANQKVRLVDAVGTHLFSIKADGQVRIGDWNTTTADLMIRKNTGHAYQEIISNGSSNHYSRLFMASYASSGYASLTMHGNRPGLAVGDLDGSVRMDFQRQDVEDDSHMTFFYQGQGAAPSNDLLKLAFQDWSTFAGTWTDAIMSWRGNGKVGIGLTDPTKALTVQARSDGERELIDLRGANAVTAYQTFMQFSPRQVGVGYVGATYAGTRREIHLGTALDTDVLVAVLHNSVKCAEFRDRGVMLYPGAGTGTAGGPQAALHIRTHPSYAGGYEAIAVQNYSGDTSQAYIGFHKGGWAASRDARIGWVGSGATASFVIEHNMATADLQLSSTRDVILKAAGVNGWKTGTSAALLPQSDGLQDIGSAAATVAKLWALAVESDANLDLAVPSGSHVQVSEAGTDVAKMEGAASAGQLSLKDQGGTYRAITGFDLQSLTNLRGSLNNQVISGLALEKHFGPPGTYDTTLVSPRGTGFAGGKFFFAISETNIAVTTPGNWFENSVPSTSWGYAFIANDGVTRRLTLWPPAANGRPNPSTPTGNIPAGLSLNDFVFIGSFRYHSAFGLVLPFKRFGDRVYYDGYAGTEGHAIFTEPDTTGGAQDRVVSFDVKTDNDLFPSGKNAATAHTSAVGLIGNLRHEVLYATSTLDAVSQLELYHTTDFFNDGATAQTNSDDAMLACQSEVFCRNVSGFKGYDSQSDLVIMPMLYATGDLMKFRYTLNTITGKQRNVSLYLRGYIEPLRDVSQRWR
jgi:hypothetical protein